MKKERQINMADTFLHDESGVSSFINEVKEYLQDYNEHVASLEQLINTMSSSSAWQDETLKTSFVNTVTSYITGYRAFAAGIEGYVECLKLKSDNIIEHESNFS
jgi:hypothetical protein